MAQTKDYYGVLGVAASAKQEEIKKQYRRLPSATIRTRTLTIQRHRTASRRSPRRITSSAILRSGSNTMRCGALVHSGDTLRQVARDRDQAAHAGRRSDGGNAGGFRFQDFDIGGLGGLGDLFGSIFSGNERGRGASGSAGTDN